MKDTYYGAEQVADRLGMHVKKPPEYGNSTLTEQFVEPERIVRIALWGGTRFTQVMLGFVASLTGEGVEETP